MMEYKGYIGKVEFDSEAGFFYGEVINIIVLTAVHNPVVLYGKEPK